MTHIKVAAPMRFFANDADLDFLPADMGLVLNALYNFLVEAKDNGALFIPLNLDIFEGALQGNALQLYTDWKLKRLKQKGASVDGRTVVNTHLLAISEPFEPDKLAYLCPPL